MIQLTGYLEGNTLIHSNQYGFRKFHSTEYAALYLVDSGISDSTTYRHDLTNTTEHIIIYTNKTITPEKSKCTGQHYIYYYRAILSLVSAASQQ